MIFRITDPARSVCVTREAVRDYNEYSQALLKGTVWAADCKSWYKNGKTEGKVTALYAGSVLHFRGNVQNSSQQISISLMLKVTEYRNHRKLPC
jgi:hypothetical protein